MKHSAPVSMGEFAYRPKEMLSAVSRYLKIHLRCHIMYLQIKICLPYCVVTTCFWTILLICCIYKDMQNVTMKPQWPPTWRRWIWQKKTLDLLMLMLLMMVNKWWKDNNTNSIQFKLLVPSCSNCAILSPFKILMTLWRIWTTWWRRPSTHLQHRTPTIQVFIIKLSFFKYLDLVDQNVVPVSPVVFWNVLWLACKTASRLIFFQSSLCLYSSVRVNPGYSDGGSQIHQHDISQTGANSFPQKKVSSTQVPAICFDLGNEWDDFDDENLLCASEALLTSCPANANPCQGKIPGRESWISFSCRAHSLYVFLYAVGVTSAAPVFLHHSQVKACVTTTSRPLGYGKSFWHVPLPQQ